MGRRSSGLNITAYMDDNVIRELQYLAERFPNEMRRAMGGVGYFMMSQMRASIREGGPAGTGIRWQKLSLVHVFHRLEYGSGRSKAENSRELNRLKNLTREQRANRNRAHPIPHAFSRWRSEQGTRDRNFPMQRMLGGIRYRVSRDGTQVTIGGLKPSMRKYLRAVQDGAVLPGSRGGGQRITPNMRLLFWLSGVPLSDRKRVLERPKRPLVDPLFRKYGQAMIDYIRARVDVTLIGPYERRDVTARRVGMYRRFRTF